MSSTQATQTSQSSPSPSSPPDGGSSSSTLYLFTFLATLFLLLLVSTAIIFRSWAIRRRFRLQVEDALAAGLLQPPQSRGRRHKRRRDLGEKPRLYDKWVKSGGGEWEAIMPISAQITPDPSIPRPINPRIDSDVNGENPLAPTPATTLPSRNLLTRWCAPRPSPASLSLPSHSLPQPSPTPKPSKPKAGTLQISVLVSMPSPKSSSRARAKAEEAGVDVDEEEGEEGMPDVVVGVARIPFWGRPRSRMEHKKQSGDEVP